MFRIGEFSRLTQVTVRMLRYYDETGLLRQARVDSLTGYRLYETRQIPRLNQIIYLRDSGFTVAEIAAALDAEDEGLLAEQLGQVPVETALAGMDGLGRMMVEQSALLSAGLGAVEELRQKQAEEDVPPAEEPPEVEDDDDQTVPQLQPPAEPDDVREMTGVGREGGQYFNRNGVYLYDRTNKGLDPSVFDAGAVHFGLGEGPQILILHSHGSEAYSQNDGDLYQESDAYRTTDCTHNVVRVGEAMAEVFRGQGFQVIHDTNLYDYPAYNGSYDRSKAAVRDWLAKYPTIRIILDVHRDALVGSDGSIYKLVTQENGKKTAQVMLVVGTDGGGAQHPYWIDNLALAVRFQEELISDYVSLARPIVLRNSSYNQQLSPGYLLVEVGGHGNTLTEAVDGARLFAQSVSQVLNTMWVT